MQDSGPFDGQGNRRKLVDYGGGDHEAILFDGIVQGVEQPLTIGAHIIQ